MTNDPHTIVRFVGTVGPHADCADHCGWLVSSVPLYKGTDEPTMDIEHPISDARCERTNLSYTRSEADNRTG